MERLESELKRLVAAGFPIIYLLTHEEERAVAAVRAVADTMPVRVWSLLRGFEDGIGAGDPFAAVREATGHTRPGLFVFLDLHPFLADPRIVRAIRDLAHVAPQAHRTALFVMPRAVVPPEIEKEVAIVDVPLPGTVELGAFLAQEQRTAGAPAAAAIGDGGEPGRAARGLTADEARRAFRLALAESDHGAGLRRVVDEKKRILRQSACLEFVEETAAFEQVGGLDALKAWVRARSRAFGDEARAFGLPAPRGVLLLGVQGCGKSLAAKATAGTFRLPLIRLDFAAVFASPSPEDTLRQALRVAEAMAPAVLWIDEIEKGLGGTVAAAADTRVFGSFLTGMQEKREAVVVAATAHDIEGLPPELARRGRFDDIFFVDLPALKEREEILAIHLRARGRDPAAYPVDKLARESEQFSGAELEQVVVAALYRAFGRGSELAAVDLERATAEVVPLATTYEERLAALREWARTRARRASADRRTLELFEA
ncbi:MAG: AAA family ATPase [Deltaproteobacteria bacterium]|nr:AAA family ATPase [Deltaproteobacteria bacterium]